MKPPTAFSGLWRGVGGGGGRGRRERSAIKLIVVGDRKVAGVKRDRQC